MGISSLSLLGYCSANSLALWLTGAAVDDVGTPIDDMSTSASAHEPPPTDSSFKKDPRSIFLTFFFGADG